MKNCSLDSLHQLSSFLPKLKELRKVQLKENPIAKRSDFFKEVMYLGGAKLKKINGKEISLFQKKFVSNMKNRVKQSSV